MKVLYLILLLVAAILLILDTFAASERGTRYAIRLLPAALFFWVLVPLIQTAKSL